MIDAPCTKLGVAALMLGAAVIALAAPGADAVTISFDNPPTAQLGPADWSTIPDVRFYCQPFGRAVTFPLVISHRSGSIAIDDAPPRAITFSNPFYIRQRNEFGNYGTVLQFLVVKGEGWTFLSTSPTGGSLYTSPTGLDGVAGGANKCLDGEIVETTK
jgi:hypothetical protein